MFKKAILTLLIPLPLMALVIAAALSIEFQRQPAAAALKLSPMEFVQLKVSQLMQSREARAAVSKQNRASPSAPAPELDVAKSATDSGVAATAKNLSAAQAAQIARAQAAVQAELAKKLQQIDGAAAEKADVSLGERFSSLFSSGKKVEDEKPQRMICKMHRGYKRCRFPKEK